MYRVRRVFFFRKPNTAKPAIPAKATALLSGTFPVRNILQGTKTRAARARFPRNRRAPSRASRSARSQYRHTTAPPPKMIQSTVESPVMWKGGDIGTSYLDLALFLTNAFPVVPSLCFFPFTATNCSFPSLLLVARPANAAAPRAINGSGMSGPSADGGCDFMTVRRRLHASGLSQRTGNQGDRGEEGSR